MMILLLYIILLLSIILISTQVIAYDKLQVHLVGHSHDDPGIIIILLLYILYC